ncbi:hypothetical protein Tco_0832015 [Tanacetum coccineum]
MQNSFPSRHRVIVLRALVRLQDLKCVVYIRPRHISKDAGVSLVLRIDDTLPLVEKVDSEATVEAYAFSESQAMADRTGN